MPWSVFTRRTRGGSSDSKRWAVMFSCMSTRAVHIEVIESLDTSGFINAYRRFTSIRGPVKHIRSDRGTNFIGACKELQIPSNIDFEQVNRYLAERGCKWTFNPPHSSHMGGSWERMIGLARKILDSMLLQTHSRLTHESLTTLMADKRLKLCQHLLVHLMQKTCANGSGVKCKASPMCSGTSGGSNICPISKHALNGKASHLIWSQVVLCS